MQTGDGFIYYSPKETMDSDTPLQAFTAIGRLTDNELWQAEEGDFRPWRRRVSYVTAIEAPIRPLLDELSFTKGRASWGYVFRYGLVEITEADFKLIAKAMKATP